MKGTYKVILQSKKMKYDFEVKRNITIIRGDSATGKTTLINMLSDYNNYGTDSGINLFCEKKCVVLSGRDWKQNLSYIRDSIVFIDEGSKFIVSKEFAHTIKDTDNYYVLITREKLATLPYSVNEIYGIRTSGKYMDMRQIYNEMYHLYPMPEVGKIEKPTLIISEDSNAGYEFFSNVGLIKGFDCISANGKSNIVKNIVDRKDENILIIVDGAAFGPEMDAVIKLINRFSNYSLYTPESFEWLVLKSGIFQDFAFEREMKDIINNPSAFIESASYFSWENYFTDLLIRTTKDLKDYAYSKNGKLKNWYKQSNNMNKILNSIDEVKFD